MNRLFTRALPVRLERDGGRPVALQVGAKRFLVAEVVRHWRVEIEWWRDEPQRDYLTLRTSDGTLLELFGDPGAEDWHLQRLSD